ncbi:hypothetical protein [Aeromonas hydrophila]|uniref:hypothetical protein n=1 Tax=Aeromonas hydrophila TaxID=644 RepID=UPI000A53C959|nr:hypothetical protein [Aeromonas hydrophila]EGX6956760.1 hypothetical protein [Aeromonas hydrophila]MCA4698762.1 hypothetical protein [Aeromonas hydrophila]MCO4221766.1 hypothetical protein [Aeromonas hydrophila]QIO17491.1 hypothetical protein G9455_06315 [Aeromonas hydrophila]USJ77845.1 hypothetical protein LDP97_01910 [Aeromonas hydrophila]
MKNKALIVASVLVSSITVAGVAHAAATNGSVQLNWQGTTPAAQITPTGWSFQDALGQPFVPTTTQLTFQKETDGSLSISSVSNINFSIVPASSTLNTVGAYLGSAPTSSGFNSARQLSLGASAQPNNNEVVILMNNQPLKVGAGNPTSVTGANGSGSQAVSIGLAAKAAAGSFAPSSVVGFSVPVIFSVDVNA